jgi:putative endonuclease
MHYVYVLQALDDRNVFYLGFSSNLKQRVKTHNAGTNASTARYSWRVVYYEAYVKEGAARRREATLKRSSSLRSALMRRVRRDLQSD